MKLIVGLGNPGIEYKETRHNIGFMVLDSFVEKHNIVFDKNKFNSLYCTGVIDNQKVILVKPLSYMNLSGDPVRAFVNFYKIDVKDILIVYDDLDIKIGNYKLKENSSSGGHNGIKSIINCLNTDSFKRLKIGIGSENKKEIKDFVLGKFTRDEKEVVSETILSSTAILEDFIRIDFASLMNKYN